MNLKQQYSLESKSVPFGLTQSFVSYYLPLQGQAIQRLVFAYQSKNVLKRNYKDPASKSQCKSENAGLVDTGNQLEEEQYYYELLVL